MSHDRDKMPKHIIDSLKAELERVGADEDLIARDKDLLERLAK